METHNEDETHESTAAAADTSPGRIKLWPLLEITTPLRIKLKRRSKHAGASAPPSTLSKPLVRVVHISDTHGEFYQLPCPEYFSCDGDVIPDEGTSNQGNMAMRTETTTKNVFVHSGDFFDHWASYDGDQEEIKRFNLYLKQEVAPKFDYALLVDGNHSCLTEQQPPPPHPSLMTSKDRHADIADSEKNKNDNNQPTTTTTTSTKTKSSTTALEHILFDGLPIFDVSKSMTSGYSTPQQTQHTTTTTTPKCQFCLLHDKKVDINGVTFAGSPWMTMGAWDDPSVDSRQETFSRLLRRCCDDDDNNDEAVVGVDDGDDDDKQPQQQHQQQQQQRHQPLFPAADVLITHVPPFGMLDRAGVFPISCRGLMKSLRLNALSVCLSCFGHNHLQWGVKSARLLSPASVSATNSKLGREHCDHGTKVGTKSTPTSSTTDAGVNGEVMTEEQSDVRSDNKEHADVQIEDLVWFSNGALIDCRGATPNVFELVL